MYGSALRKAEQNLLERTERRMLRCVMGIKRIEDQEIRARECVATTREKIREARLGWLGLVERKAEEDVVITAWKMEVGGHRKIEGQRTKLRWSDVIRKARRRNKYR